LTSDFRQMSKAIGQMLLSFTGHPRTRYGCCCFQSAKSL